jgi:uncharacterized pyridoxamine 5'-phosphate oxidase family protein
MEVQAFSDIKDEFASRVEAQVWCNMATVDRAGRPRSRIVHPLWEGCTGWVCTHRTSFKSQHLLRNPNVSLAYIMKIHEPVYIDCTAGWVDDLDQKQRVWDLFKSTPPPVGYDPSIDFIRPDHENFGLLRLIPWRIAVVTFPAPSHEAGQRIWRQPATYAN